MDDLDVFVAVLMERYVVCFVYLSNAVHKALQRLIGKPINIILQDNSSVACYHSTDRDSAKIPHASTICTVPFGPSSRPNGLPCRSTDYVLHAPFFPWLVDSTPSKACLQDQRRCKASSRFGRRSESTSGRISNGGTFCPMLLHLANYAVKSHSQTPQLPSRLPVQ